MDNKMELKVFISETLQSIANGIIEAQNKMPLGATVNPSDIREQNNKPHGLNFNPMQDIEFDIAISVLEGSETKGGIGVLAGALNLGTSGKSENSNTSQSKIRFTVPMVFSQQKEKR
jgi:hypothetical protein